MCPRQPHYAEMDDPVAENATMIGSRYDDSNIVRQSHGMILLPDARE